jgi:hypothetical protein
MHVLCPNCKSKNIKCVETQVDNVKCICLDCNHKFDRFPTIEERDNFNG